MSEKGQAKYEKYANKSGNELKHKIKINRIGILGESGVGKTYFLGKLINKENLIKYHIPTKGISVIYPQN
jgi:GTPase SAR1 family protein